MAKLDQAFGQIGDNALRASIEPGRHGFMERRHMGYSHSLAFPSRIIAEVEMHQPPERSRNGKKSAIAGVHSAGPLPFIERRRPLAGNQLAKP
ncbi:hypothetical protein [Mesorhizobium sp. M9A.F.Ca.ET.002.03.1.2]|uniref:hypothetical protein n=1 Tax=Mesorhizobium sp. M9A.F.Ca.ET.002.03.1.2 TaxID=2493668 RepID=UPI00167A632B|nr:hypothetical protein [Mesorhizobium sp. M9A.F.Ca.ET.002.03.1.2]